MLVDFVRFFKGYVDFTASGKFPERFLNITARNGIALWNAHPTPQGLRGSMSAADYKSIRRTAKKARVKTRVVKRHGLPFIAARYKFRIGLPIGAALGIILLIVLSNFIWSFSVVGAENISETRIMEALSENGVRAGTFKGSVDVQQVERSMLLEIDEITWMSVNILGSSATVEIKEKAQKPQIEENPVPSNVKAKCDGVITKINAKSGMSEVQVGSGVVKGDLLVSGINATKQNTVLYVHADAEVFADVVSNKELKLPKSFEYYSFSENKIERTRLRFLWAEFPFSLSFGSFENTVYSRRENSLVLNETVLPLSVKTETVHEMLGNNISVDKKTASEIFKNSLLLYEAFEKSDSAVVSRNVSVNEKENGFDCSADYIFNENIAETVDFSVTEE